MKAQQTGYSKRFSKKKDADKFSESLRHLWTKGIGLVTGPFTSKEAGPKPFYEVNCLKEHTVFGS